MMTDDRPGEAMKPLILRDHEHAASLIIRPLKPQPGLPPQPTQERTDDDL
jgi:hypothetical protein